MKQIILKNNVIEIYKKLKNDKEKSQFLLKIFKFLVENDESFEAKDKINLAFMGIKPSLKITESGGGNNNPSGKNQHNEEDTLTSDDLGQPLNKNISIKEEKNISNKEISIKEKEKKEKEKEKNDFVDYQFVENEYNKGDFDFDLNKFWNFWKDKGLRKTELTNKLISWDIKDRDKRKLQNITQSLAKQIQVNKDLKYRQEQEQKQDEEPFYL